VVTVDAAVDGTPRKSALDRLLSLAADVRPGEGGMALLLALNGFLLLAAYYAIRPLRSAFLLPVELQLPGGTVLAGPAITSYSGAVLAALFLVIVPLYSSVASRVTRIRLINSVTLFFIVTLLGFFALARSGAYPAVLGVTFFLWIGVFNLMVIAQFWSFANDLYTPDQGKRLFAIVGFGGSVGATAGALVTSILIGRIGAVPMMLVAAGALAACMAISNLVHQRDRRRPRAVSSGGDAAAAEQAIGGASGFRLVMGHRYLLFIGLLTLTVQVVNTNGNYILNETVRGMAVSVAAADGAAGPTEGDIIGGYMAGIDFWQNTLSMLIQFFLVSRIFKYLGVGGSLFVLPLLALGSYGLFALAPVLALIRVTKIAENATDYSLQNTVRRALFLPTSREAKYKALQAVETFFWRAGDMLSAVATFVIVQWLALSVRAYAAVNLVIIVGWIALAVVLARENRRMMADSQQAAA
jgi:AAA family ATP:ADP antiporter